MLKVNIVNLLNCPHRKVKVVFRDDGSLVAVSILDGDDNHLFIIAVNTDDFRDPDSLDGEIVGTYLI